MSDFNFVKHLRFRTDLQKRYSFLFEIELKNEIVKIIR
jgi:hypothetical protein